MKFFRIEEFSKLSGISASSLRIYDKNGTFLPVRKTPSGQRLYSEEQLEDVYKGNFEKWARKVNSDKQC